VRVRVVVAAAAVLAAAGCGTGTGTGTGGAGDPPPARVPAAATLLPDGTVPWVDEPAGLREYDTPPRARRTDPAAGPCRAEDLRGELAAWLSPRPGAGGWTAAPDGPGKLIGEATVTNTGQRACRLRGEVDTRIRDAAGELPIGYSHSINAEGRERTTIVPPGGSASLRLDWTAPYCAREPGPLQLEIRLPEDGGSLLAPVRSRQVPVCSTSETHPELRSYLSSSGFDEPVTETVDDSPLGALTASVEPVRTVRTGDLATFHVTLRNPTGAAVPLDPGPGYYQEMFSQGDAGTPAVNQGGTYRLNCRPVRSVPAHGAVRFAMGVHVPAGMTPGRTLDVTWRLIAPNLAAPPALQVHFTATLAP
jgi:hypothetical protein